MVVVVVDLAKDSGPIESSVVIIVGRTERRYSGSILTGSAGGKSIGEAHSGPPESGTGETSCVRTPAGRARGKGQGPLSRGVVERALPPGGRRTNATLRAGAGARREGDVAILAGAVERSTGRCWCCAPRH